MPHILVLDDDQAIRRLLVRILEYDGHIVDVAATAADANAKTDAFDIAILDIDLPDGTGVDVAEALHQRGLGIRIVFFTASTDPVLLGRAALLGTLIRKDAGLKTLLGAL